MMMTTVLVVMTMLRHIDALIPVILDEVHRRAAGTVAVTVLVPVFDVLGRRMQVDWSRTIGGRLHDHGLTVDQLRRRVPAHINAAVEAGLSDADGKTVGMAAG